MIRKGIDHSLHIGVYFMPFSGFFKILIFIKDHQNAPLLSVQESKKIHNGCELHYRKPHRQADRSAKQLQIAFIGALYAQMIDDNAIKVPCSFCDQG